jgi:hypothetical protein
MHALSVSDSCLRFNRDQSAVTLLTDPSFLGKNQIPSKGSEPILIPALPSDFSSHPGADPGFQVRGAHLKKLRRAEAGTKIFGVFRVKNLDFTPKNHILCRFKGW